MSVHLQAAIPTQPRLACRFRLVVASEPKTVESAWSELSNWLLRQPRRIALTRAAYLAIIHASEDGLGFSAQTISKPFAYPRWLTLVNANRSPSGKLEISELSDLFHRMVEINILSYKIGQGPFGRGQPMMQIEKSIYEIALAPSSLDALGLTLKATEFMWRESLGVRD